MTARQKSFIFGLVLIGLGSSMLLLAGCGAGTSISNGFAAQRAYDAGLARYDAKDYAGAVGHFERAVRLYPSFDDAEAYLAWTYYRLGEYTPATRHFRQALLRQPEWAGLHNGLGWSRYRVDRYHIAISAFQDALALDPQYRDALAGLAYCMYALERFDEARPLFERLVREGEGGAGMTPLSDVEEIRARYAWTLFYLGQYAAARDQFAKGVAAHADWAGLHNGLAWSTLHLGDHLGATASFQRALALRPDLADAQEGLALAKRQAEGGRAAHRASPQ